MQRINIDVEPRDLGKKSNLNPNQLRSLGWVPGVLYGHGNPVKIAVATKSFDKAIHTEAGVNALFNVKLGGKVNLGIIKELQRDIFSQKPIHVDFLRINLKEKIDVNIPVHVEGVAIGVKDNGGILDHMEREIHLRCLPDQIPPHIDVDVSKLDIHDSIKVEQLNIPKEIEVLTPGDHIVVHVVPPKIEEEPAPAAEAVEGAEGAAAEPEVIAKGKEKEEEGAEAGKGGKPAPGKAAPAKPEAKSEKK